MTIRAFQSHTPQFDDTVYIDPQSSVIGNVKLGSDASVWPFASIRGDLLPIVIGERSNVQDNCTLHTTLPNELNPNGFSLSIGDDVTLGHGAIAHGCQIGNRVLVGMNAVVLDGAIVEDDVMIGAGAVVGPGKHLKSGQLYVGNPIRVMRKLTEVEIKMILQNTQNYIQTQRAYPK